MRVCDLSTAVPGSELCNLALHKPAYQTSVTITRDGVAYPPFLANDGNRTNKIKTECAFTHMEENPLINWWVVDLGIPMTVKFVHMTTYERRYSKFTRRCDYLFFCLPSVLFSVITLLKEPVQQRQ